MPKRDTVYGSAEDQPIPHPGRFPGSSDPAHVMALGNGRHVIMDLASEDDTDMNSYGEETRNCSSF